MYFHPQPAVCPKCGHEENVSPDRDVHSDLPEATLTNEGKSFEYRMPVCRKCWEAWLKANFPIMDWKKKTS